jgi:hypothetical protein
MKLRPLDFIAILLSIIAIAGFSVYAYSGRNKTGDVVIEASGQQWIYPLSADRREIVKGPIGATIVVIRDGKAFVEDSPCPDKLCVHMPAISKPGQWIACLPNKVFVRVRGNSGQGIDQLSY